MFHFLMGIVSYLTLNFTYKWLKSPVIHQELINSSQTTVVASLKEGSSLWCIDDTKSKRICKFRYLCYHPVQDHFLFFHGPETVIDGVPDNRFDPALLDLSSVDDHNTQYFNYVDYPVSALDTFSNITVMDGFSLIFNRFNADNIMHVVHDDLLPLFHTLRQFSWSRSSIDLEYTLVMMEGWNEGAYFDLYKLFTNKPPLLKRDLQKPKQLICFQHGVVGISKYTTWYQYGFKEPQGALPHTSVTGHYVRQFVMFIKRRLGLDSGLINAYDSSYVILCSREHNRLITNEPDLSMAIARHLNKQVIHISMTIHAFKEQVQLVSKASALIGMHGSILIMAMFLPPDLPWMDIVYGAWRNEIEENTITYPHEAPEVGGIVHLSDEEQKQIMGTKEVPRHLCCSNPYWLYRIYQDTTVDIKSLLLVTETAENKQRKMSSRPKPAYDHTLYPSKVINVTCQLPPEELQPALWFSWEPPLNIPFIAGRDVRYEVWIQPSGQENYAAYILDLTEYTFTENLLRNTHYNVWVRCIVNENSGPFGDVAHCETK
ncbi:Protein O-linked-mannose beta-1,4-N-acetylglucosaminyltransferase 2 [Stylophora pistillata]|uniref:Protein O-linked-mannose beta-1,4-N-acetylglucosaminyltransferase 2 n=2 Tax=Stylophora pistillata TaxID=50429 RepID=A0A2B4RU95_STYPI|nr:Protein O-linked-mannose beta-1,4-N-acetylglucosaminyltransferase 2 [Stylophora pistillata]